MAPESQNKGPHVKENRLAYPKSGAVGATPLISLSNYLEEEEKSMAPKAAPNGPIAGPPERRLREDDVQFATALVLDALGLQWCHVPNEALNRGGMMYGATQVGLGVKGGVPDVLIFDPPPAMPGRVGVALELKTLVGRASESQRRWISGLSERGWAASVERGLRAVLARLSALGWDVQAALAKVREKLGWELATNGERMVRVTKGKKA